MNVLLAVIGNGRSELLSQTLKSLEDQVQFDWMDQLMINDTGNEDYTAQLDEAYGIDWHIISHTKNRGLSGSVRSVWQYARIIGADYVFHVEEDFTFNEKINIQHMIDVMEHEPNMLQLALKRQPCNAEEAAAGGFMEMDPRAYEQVEYRERTPVYTMGSPNPRSFGRPPLHQFVKHRKFFTLNPSLYPLETTDYSWELGWGEKEFGEVVFGDQNNFSAYLGHITDPPKVTHIGGYRAEGWFV